MVEIKKKLKQMLEEAEKDYELQQAIFERIEERYKKAKKANSNSYYRVEHLKQAIRELDGIADPIEEDCYF